MRWRTSDKWFDAAWRPICPALTGRPGWAIRDVGRLNRMRELRFSLSSLRSGSTPGDDG